MASTLMPCAAAGRISESLCAVAGGAAPHGIGRRSGPTTGPRQMASAVRMARSRRPKTCRCHMKRAEDSDGHVRLLSAGECASIAALPQRYRAPGRQDTAETPRRNRSLPDRRERETKQRVSPEPGDFHGTTNSALGRFAPSSARPGGHRRYRRTDHGRLSASPRPRRQEVAGTTGRTASTPRSPRRNVGCRVARSSSTSSPMASGGTSGRPTACRCTKRSPKTPAPSRTSTKDATINVKTQVEKRSLEHRRVTNNGDGTLTAIALLLARDVYTQGVLVIVRGAVGPYIEALWNHGGTPRTGTTTRYRALPLYQRSTGHLLARELRLAGLRRPDTLVRVND